MSINEQNFIFGNTVKRLKKESKKTQYELANHLNMTLRGYQDIESGKSGTSLARLINLADYFNCSVDYLLGHKVNETEIQQNLIQSIKMLDADLCGLAEAYIEGLKTTQKIRNANKQHNKK